MHPKPGGNILEVTILCICKFILRNISFILEECKERNVKTFVKAFLGFCTKFEF